MHTFTKYLTPLLISTSLLGFYSGNVSAIDNALTTAEISSLVDNKTTTCQKEKDKSLCTTFFNSNGEIKRHTHADDKRRSGTWQSANNKLCVHWQGKKKELCFDVVPNSDNQYNLIKKGKVKSTILTFADGNTENL